ncbi:hypothetical protein [Mucilaginibacter paludis]|nr:hypothetical protein [Mucilaginibacter paludis]
MNFSFTIDNIEFRFNSMHTLQPKLFQVYVQIENKTRRFHFKLNDSGDTFEFAQREDCPATILEYETELSERLKKQYGFT